MSTIAVLDIGKTNVKVVQYTTAGEQLRDFGMPNRSIEGPPYLHPDVGRIWTFALEALGQFHALDPIGDIVVTAHGACGAVVGGDPDIDDGLVLPILDYESALPDASEARYAEVRPAFARTMTPPLDHGLVLGRAFAALAWTFPADFARARALLMLPQYWAWRLSGVMASEVTSIACHTDMWQPVAGGTSTLVERMGWEHLLPPLRPAWEVLGLLRPALARQWRLDPGTRIRNGIHDSNASLLPHLIARPAPFTVVSTGTWVVLMAVGGDTARLDPMADMLANVDATGRPVACAKFMGGREFATLAGAQMVDAGAGDLSAVIAANVFALPAFAEAGGPFSGRKGRVVGTLPDRPGASAALATLYVALVTDLLLDRLGVSGPLVVEGSFARNRAFGAILAQLRPQQTVEIAHGQAGTARGAALLAVWPTNFSAPGDQPPHTAPSWDIPGLADYRREWHRRVSL